MTDFQTKLKAVVVKAMQDEKFCTALEANPHQVLEAEGLPVPPEVNVHILREKTTPDGKREKYLVIPLASAEMGKVAGGVNWGEIKF